MSMKDKKLTALIICAIIAGGLGCAVANTTTDNTSDEAQKILDDISEQEAIYFPTQYTIKEIDERYKIISMYAVPTIERPPLKYDEIKPAPAMKYGAPVREEKIIKKEKVKPQKMPLLRYAPLMRADD